MKEAYNTHAWIIYIHKEVVYPPANPAAGMPFLFCKRKAAADGGTIKRFWGSCSSALVLMAWLGSLSLPQAPCWATTALPLACFLLPCSRLQCHFLLISTGLAEFRYLHVAYIDLFLLTVGASLHCFSSFPGCLCLGLVLCCTVVACSFSVFLFRAVPRAEGRSIARGSVTAGPLTQAELGRNRVRREKGAKLHACGTDPPPLEVSFQMWTVLLFISSFSEQQLRCQAHSWL